MNKRMWLFLAAISFFYGGFVFGANPQVTLQITGGVTGTIVLEVYADKAPVTAANFINYVKSGFYNGLIFHRVISGFMIQGGGYNTTLDEKTPGAAIINESSNRLSNLRGTIAMARTSYADSATSQFFINLVDNAGLDYGYIPIDYGYYPPKQNPTQIGYCVFGKVLSGLTVVDQIAAVKTRIENGMQNVPENDIIIQTATVSYTAPVCAEKLPGDANGDCKINISDLALMASNWLKCNSILSTCN